MEFIKVKMKKKAIIVSIKGSVLTNKEKLLFLNEKPWGLILFKRKFSKLNFYGKQFKYRQRSI